MDQTFYVNVLFGKNRKRLFDELKKIVFVRSELNFQVNPFRISPVAELTGQNNTLRVEIQKHLVIMKDINESDINSLSRPFNNTIFVNYTTAELQPALKYQRIRYYLCDYINKDNIELLTLVAPKYITFLQKFDRSRQMSINSYFINYSILMFRDTNADTRISNTTTLDMGEETSDDVTYVLQTRLKATHLIEDNDTIRGGIILPYYPFSNSVFTSTQNTKDNLNAITIAPEKHLIYYPFGQAEWLDVLQHITYERVLLNYLISASLYKDEYIKIPVTLFRNTVSYNFRHFQNVQKKYKTQLLNNIIFDYTESFVNNSRVYANWLNIETKFKLQVPPIVVNVFCTTSSNGLFI